MTPFQDGTLSGFSPNPRLPNRHREYISEEADLPEVQNISAPTTMDQPDARILFQQFLNGDDRAFAEIYREFNPRLSAYCYKVVPEQWEDVMQELWERVIALRSKRGRMGTAWGAHHAAIDSPLAFLFRMVKNLIIDNHRRSVETREIEEEDLLSASTTTTDVECIILEAFEKLPFEDREVLVLNIYSGYKFGEIAEMQGKSVDAVWARASRARTKLRQIVMADAKRLGVSLPSGKNETKAAASRTKEMV